MYGLPDTLRPLSPAEEQVRFYWLYGTAPPLPSAEISAKNWRIRAGLLPLC